MSGMGGLAEIAKRLNVNERTAHRLIASELEALKLQLTRGKGDKVFLSRDYADKQTARYEARRGPVTALGEEAATFDRYGYF